MRIGALTRYRDLERDPAVARDLPLIHEALPHIAHPQIRNRGTIGGNLAHADPASEMPAIVLALGGKLRAQSVRGERWIDAADFFAGALSTALEPDEMLTAVELPAAQPRLRRLLYGSVAPARRLRHHRRRLHADARRRRALQRRADRAVQCRRRAGVRRPKPARRWSASRSTPPRSRRRPSYVSGAIDPGGSIHASKEFQRHLAGVLTARLDDANERARHEH